MAHLYVDLYTEAEDRLPCYRLDDHNSDDRQYFHALDRYGASGKTSRVVVKPGDEYRLGDHICLFEQSRPGDTDTIIIDPDISTDVKLRQITLDEGGLVDHTAAILFVTNPNRDSRFRLRISLYDTVGAELPWLVFYDWETSLRENLTNLERFRFANKTAFILIDEGPAYQSGDLVILRARTEAKAPMLALEPGGYDLTQFPLQRTSSRWSFAREQKSWAEAVTDLGVDLSPRLVMN